MKYYFTVPIYYVNAAPHIGHFYTTMAADAIKRVKQMQGYDVTLATGTDEHGQKVERAARAMGKTPEEYTTVISNEFSQTWQATGLAVDRFVRTTDPRHHETVKMLFQRCLERGHIYKGSYTGQYCFHDELYVNDAKPGDPCPDCGRTTETVTEENYFFRLSAFQEKLLALYESRPDFIRPEIRRNEVMAFVKQGLNDLSITRTTIKWGIPVPVEGNHVFYVWFDALTTYMTAARLDGTDLWPADLHLIGKEIIRFHAVYWPAFLMAADLPLPRGIFAHGWLLFENDKMSKSRGNIVRATPIQQVVGMDALRYFLLREIPFGSDGSFSFDALVARYNADLANGLGNLVSRTLTMLQQYRKGVVPALPPGGDQGIAEKTNETIRAAIQAYDNFEFAKALETIWSLVSVADKFIVTQAPWTLVKKQDEASQQALDATLYTVLEVIRVVTALASPVIPGAAAKISAQLALTGPISLNGLAFGQLAAGHKAGQPEPVFPRIDPKIAVPKMQELEAAETARQAALVGKKIEEPAEPAVPPSPLAPEINIDDFMKVDLRVGLVKTAEAVKGADKLLHLSVDIGEAEPRSIVAGIAKAYAPEQMVGRKVVIVANLQPRKLRGLTSQGMIVAASLEGGSPVLAAFLEDVPVGARLK